jgi:glycerol-3-phosphate acyltransferase PlsY
MFAALIEAGLIGYLIGSVPSAYLITKWKTGLDLRQSGSGNIGALNSFEVTKQKSVGVYVLLADLLKGALPIAIAELLGLQVGLVWLAVGLVLGHCYPVWLKFHGGRGLATAAGICLATNPYMLLAWLLFYSVALTIKRHVHFGAFIAIVALAFLLTVLSDRVISMSTLSISGLTPWGLRTMALGILIVIFSRHVQPFFELMTGKSAKANSIVSEKGETSGATHR